MPPSPKPRQITKYRYDRPVYYLSSQKNNRQIWCDSLLERDRALVLEFDDTVLRYQCQPLSFVYQSAKGKAARYTPDFLVQRTTGYAFEEVKPGSWTDSAKFRSHLQRLQFHSQHRFDAPLLLVTDRDIRVQDKIPNYKLLYRYRRVASPAVSQRKLRANLGKAPTFADLKDFMSRQNFSVVQAYALLFQRRLTFDVARRLCDQTELEIA